jgi:hypothetical protein
MFNFFKKLSLLNKRLNRKAKARELLMREKYGRFYYSGNNTMKQMNDAVSGVANGYPGRDGSPMV